MKKTILMFAAATLMIAAPSCKKGENDPGLSFSSRKSRLAGTWDMTSADYTSTSQSDWGGDVTTTSTVYSYDGTTMTSTTTTSNSSGSVTSPAQTETQSTEIVFTKDGTYETTQTTDGNTSVTAGNWYFNGKNKSADVKKKEAVILVGTSYTWSGNTSTYEGTGIGPDAMMHLDRLAKDEMIVIVDWTYTDSDGLIDTQSGTWTYTKE